jgi:hypothetical protein
MPKMTRDSLGDAKYTENTGWKSEGKSLLRKHRCRWDDNIKMDLKEIGVNWIKLYPIRMASRGLM